MANPHCGRPRRSQPADVEANVDSMHDEKTLHVALGEDLPKCWRQSLDVPAREQAQRDADHHRPDYRDDQKPREDAVAQSR